MSNASSIVATLGSVCTIVGDGGVLCWGSNDYGSLGVSGASSPTPVAPSVAGPVAQLAAGDESVCALLRDGQSVECWGALAPDWGYSQPQLIVADAGTVRSLAGGYNTFCAVFASGQVACWGANYYGALGLGTADASMEVRSPSLVPLDGGATQMCVGLADACVLTSDHRLICWGHNNASQLGPNITADPSPSPQDTGIANVREVRCNGLDTCAIFDDGGVSCWGDNEEGELGQGAGGSGAIATPRAIPNLGPASALAVGSTHSCAKADAGLWCWGVNDHDDLGSGVDAGPAPYGAFPVAF